MSEKTKSSEESLTESSEGERNTKELEEAHSLQGQGSGKQVTNESSESLLSEAIKKLSLRPPTKKALLQEPTYDSFINCLKNNCFKKIITIVGAGISTSAGIPDFRSPDTGLYENLANYNLPYPQAIFEIKYFKKYPAAFFDLAKKLIPGNFKPTISHHFIRLLELKGLLIRHYTQNVDGLERKAGISDDKLVEAHGTFSSSHCIKCNKSYSFEWLKNQMEVAGVPTCVICEKVVKPDIVFFGDSLPSKFFQCVPKDFPQADLLIIMGSSLLVEPFASLVRKVNRNCPRIIINEQEVGKKVGISYDSRRNRRDVFIRGACDETCMRIINEMNWTEDFEALMRDN